MKTVKPQKEHGFTVMELLIATAIFLVICGAMFSLLQLSQQKYSSETQLSGAFQETRLAIDQIVRDFNVSGYPPRILFSALPPDPSSRACGVAGGLRRAADAPPHARSSGSPHPRQYWLP